MIIYPIRVPEAGMQGVGPGCVSSSRVSMDDGGACNKGQSVAANRKGRCDDDGGACNKGQSVAANCKGRCNDDGGARNKGQSVAANREGRFQAQKPDVPAASRESSSEARKAEKVPAAGSSVTPLHSPDFPSFPLKVDYCPANPCITRAVHALHRQVLDGVDGADVDLNRYLMVCSILSRSSWTSASSEGAREGERVGGAESGLCARLVLDCICGDPAHAVKLAKNGYRQQFRLWRRSSFVEADASRDRRHAGGGSRHTPCVPLHIPIMSLVSHYGAAPQYNLLPDLGHFMRTMLQRRYFSEQSKKHWVRAASQHQLLGGYMPNQNRHNPQNRSLSRQHEIPQQAGMKHGVPDECSREGLALPRTDSRDALSTGFTPAHLMAGKSPLEAASRLASKGWQQGHGLCATLLHDSIPCLKRSKRSCLSNASPDPSGVAYTSVEVSACINVLYGTLLKLYNMGAKVPTFKSRVAMMSRLMHLSTLPTEEQVSFLRSYPFLTRLCFMEYSLNALMDWMPCERELVFFMCTSMAAYSSVAVAMCDVFRQDAIITGDEDWALLNKAASVSIERCIRVCKFKMVKLVEPVIKSAHLHPSLFRQEALKLPFMPSMGSLTHVHEPSSALEALDGSLQGSREMISEKMQHLEAREGRVAGYSSPFDDAGLQLVAALLRSSSQESMTVEHTKRDLQAIMESCRVIQDNIRIHALPDCVAWAQMESLDSIHSASTSRLASAQRISFCALCAANGKGFKGKLRMCCISGELSCVSCQPGETDEHCACARMHPNAYMLVRGLSVWHLHDARL